jgi:hypothetical protein
MELVDVVRCGYCRVVNNPAEREKCRSGVEVELNKSGWRRTKFKGKSPIFRETVGTVIVQCPRSRERS